MAISEKQLKEFKKTVLSAGRPLFFFDDDADGLCSYLLCHKARNGNDTSVRVHGSATVTDAIYSRKVDENAPDLVVILDKPNAEQTFLDHCTCPVVWLDHHEPQKPQGKHVTYYNPRIHDNEDNRSTAYWVYKALGRPEDLWIAAVGNITDWQLTDVAEEFWTARPDLLAKVATPPDAIYYEPFATLNRIIQFNLKGDAKDVRTAIKILSRIESPDELLKHETPRSKLLYKRYQTIHKQYEKYIAAARKAATDKELLFHLFSNMQTSLLSEISNQLLYEFPEKLIFIARSHNGEVKLSIRCSTKDVAAAVKQAMKESGARGNAGGHTHACGGNIAAEDFDKFFQTFLQILN